MKFNIKYCFILLLLLGLEVKAQNLAAYSLSGQVVADSSLLPLEGTHIIARQSGLATVAGKFGQFSLDVTAGDTLYISYVGYQTLKWPVPPNTNKQIVVLLKPADEQLQEVVVEGLPSERVLKNRILALELPDERVELDLPPWADQPISANGAPLIQIGGLVSGLASNFNKKDRGRLFRAKMQQEATEREIIAHKYNDTVIKNATGITSDAVLTEFKAYCELPHNFLLTATEYDIHKAIAECFAEFEESRES